MVLSQLSKNRVNHLRCMLRTNQEFRANKRPLNLLDEIWWWEQGLYDELLSIELVEVIMKNMWIWNLLLVVCRQSFTSELVRCGVPIVDLTWVQLCILRWRRVGHRLIVTIQADSSHHLVFAEQYYIFICFHLVGFCWMNECYLLNSRSSRLLRRLSLSGVGHVLISC